MCVCLCVFVWMYERRVGDCSSVDSQRDQCYANLLVRDCSASSTALFDPPSGSNSLMSSHFCWVSNNVVCQQQRLSALPVLTVLSWHWITQPATAWLQLAATYDLFSGYEELIYCISCMTLELSNYEYNWKCKYEWVVLIFIIYFTKSYRFFVFI